MLIKIIDYKLKRIWGERNTFVTINKIRVKKSGTV